MIIEQFEGECDTNATTPQSELAVKSKIPSTLGEEKKTETATNGPASDSTNIDEMESLYWHTHGSLYWQR